MKLRPGIGVILFFLMAIGVLAASEDRLPAYCGALRLRANGQRRHVALPDQLPAYPGGVGADSYTPPVLNIPPVVLNRGTVITVTNATIIMNGDTSSVKALVANPGPDGISLYEAITATNNDPGTWVIQFAPALKGSSISLDTPNGEGIPYLSGGNVTINGDIDGDGQPDITLVSNSGTAGIFVLSGGNTINGLVLQSFGYGVVIQRPSGKFQMSPVTGATFSNITISNTTITGFKNIGILLAPVDGEPGLTPTSPAVATGNTWDHLRIIGNTISSTASGQLLAVSLQLGGTIGDTLQHTTIANNNIVVSTAGAIGIGMAIGGGLGAINNQALDTLIANNDIDVNNQAGAAIRVSDGLGSGSANVMDGLQIVSNQIRATGPASSPGPYTIEIANSDAASDDLQPPVFPIQYSEGNIARNISILSNQITGNPSVGIWVQEACCGNRNNVLGNLSIQGNTLTGVSGVGIWLVSAAGGGYFSRTTSANALSNVLIQANSIRMTPHIYNLCNCYPPWMGLDIGGIQVTAGFHQPGNSVNGLSIANNEVDTPTIGISLLAGLGDGEGPFSADANVVAGAQIFCNQLDQAATFALDSYPATTGINVVAGVDTASGNQISQLYIADNLIAGVLSAASTPVYVGAGGSGNTLSTSTTPTPTISLVANAEGESPVIAPNIWIEIEGLDLAPQQDALMVRTWEPGDFVNGQMPTQLAGVSVTVNGKSAFVSYVNPWKLNALTPPDAIAGPVNVVVTNNGVSSAPYAAQAQPLSPSFFVFDGSHVRGTHLDGTDIGPATHYPGLMTPARPGETIIVYGNGFGQTSTPVVSGSFTQSGTLSPMPVITIGEIQANVRSAGLKSYPGEFQFEVDVPSNIADGEQPITATYNGFSTQAGAFVTVHH